MIILQIEVIKTKTNLISIHGFHIIIKFFTFKIGFCRALQRFDNNGVISINLIKIKIRPLMT